MRRVLLLMIIILLLFLPATFASEIEFQEGLNSFFGFMPAGFDFEHARQAEGGPGFSDLSTLIDLSGQPTPLFYAQRTIALKLANFQKTKKIKERIRGKIILEGQYKFINDDRVIYVLWGKGRLPSEIKGKVKVADISGSEKVLTSGSIRLTSSPIFIEIIE
ncbi:hypothetical protein CEE35_09365 [Candidatus Aerophobetes bacterium Ae_b3b]|nr:MAG: hypothetical protein CEE35_09365 [Candidatus Aerophobetes bacterium Ae_b3b]